MMSEPYYTVSARDQQAFFQQQQHPHAHPQDVYRLAHKDRSYETVTSAEGSRNSDQVGYQTDPTSSDNSSIERRRSPAKRAHPNGMAPPPPAHAGAPARYSQQQPQPPMQAQQPSQKGAIPRKEAPSVLKRTGSKAQGAAQQAPRPAAPEKKKSWLVRRFSKSS